METFKDYKMANLTKDEEGTIKKFEETIHKESGHDLVLIAYEKKDKKDLLR